MVSPLNIRLKNIIILIAVLVVSYQLSVTKGLTQEKKYIRVAVVQNAASLNLKVIGLYEIINSTNAKIISEGHNLKTTVTTYKNEILLGKITAKFSRIIIRADELGLIIINGRAFRGSVEFIKRNSEGLQAVNHIELEDYIKGVLYHEASHYWPMEALKAQAIVSRTYALYQREANKSKDFDVTSDIFSQVYGGRTSERSRTNEAVKATTGQILVYRGKTFPAYFHATCGGHTEDASALWNIDIAPLKGVACNFCEGSPHFNWHYVLSLDELKDKLGNAGYRIGEIKDIVVGARDASNRVIDLIIKSTKTEAKISSKDFRNIIGPNLIRSTNFNLSISGRDAVFEGFGWGHGVGLCQWGAYFMAKQGKAYPEILGFYYPKSNVKAVRF